MQSPSRSGQPPGYRPLSPLLHELPDLAAHCLLPAPQQCQAAFGHASPQQHLQPQQGGADSRARWQARFEAVYLRHHPPGIAAVPALLDAAQGREAAMLAALEAKYGPADCFSPAGRAAPPEPVPPPPPPAPYRPAPGLSGGAAWQQARPQSPPRAEPRQRHAAAGRADPRQQLHQLMPRWHDEAERRVVLRHCRKLLAPLIEAGSLSPANARTAISSAALGWMCDAPDWGPAARADLEHRVFAAAAPLCSGGEAW
eukprot:TRINITY_DN30617_c0_g1_i1.p1 TRINITY_DN30617_c0_g1~~TRINITY_DN30617_c0_g1_i1.p1  ORF type:complete len:278 (+),score=78.88 TRINITY_DN30617_c0_g1_i1:68-835(+)